MTCIGNTLAASAGLAIAFGAFAQSASQLRPGARLTLPCPPMQYFADPDFTVDVSESEVSPGNFRYTYTFTFNESSREHPFWRLRIAGIAQAEILEWSDNLEACSISGRTTPTVALNCRRNFRTEARHQQDQIGRVTLISPYAPGTGRYKAETAITTRNALLTEENKAAWLPYFAHDEYLLTESLQEQLMEQCSSALIVKNDERAMTGAVTVPFYADAEPKAMAARERLQPEELTKALDRLISDLKKELPEMANAGNEPRIAVKDSTGRWVTSDPQSELDWDTLYKGPPGTAAKVDLEEIKTACNIRAVFVEILPPDLAIGEQAASAAAERIAVRDYLPLERRAIEIDPPRPCEPLEEAFEFTLPDYEKRR